MADTFVFWADAPATPVAAGATRRVLAHSDAIMAVEMRFLKDAEGAPHSHPHDQVTYIVSGRFRFTNDCVTRDVGAGDSIRFAPGTTHGTVCLEDGCLVDVFTPCREDFLR